MRQCRYPYCRGWVTRGNGCPRCGHPQDDTRWRTREYFLEASLALALPTGLLDLHQDVSGVPAFEEQQLNAMEQLGIERALLVAGSADANSDLGVGAVLGLCDGNPRRFWACGYVDPRSPDALDQLVRLQSQGVRAIRLIPAMGWRPDDPALVPFWERLGALSLIALVHTGFLEAHSHVEEGQFASSAFGDPLLLDPVCRRFPHLTVVLGQCGGVVFSDAAALMIAQHEHVWGDLSGYGLSGLPDLLRQGLVDVTRLVWGNAAPPHAYPQTLRLLFAALADAHCEHLADALLRDNPRRFAGLYL